MDNVCFCAYDYMSAHFFYRIRRALPAAVNVNNNGRMNRVYRELSNMIIGLCRDILTGIGGIVIEQTDVSTTFLISIVYSIILCHYYSSS